MKKKLQTGKRGKRRLSTDSWTAADGEGWIFGFCRAGKLFTLPALKHGIEIF
jgi:hypothetical protein